MMWQVLPRVLIYTFTVRELIDFSLFKRVAHIVLSCWLALLLIFGGTAKEFFHLFTSHEDTVHHVCDDGELSFENEHHHCSFLSFSLTDFIKHELHLPRGFTKAVFPVYNSSLYTLSFKHIAPTTHLRGPPAAC
jgi:hypothetical protein